MHLIVAILLLMPMLNIAYKLTKVNLVKTSHISMSTLLTGNIRDSELLHAKERGWKLVDQRDAIQKSFVFTDFVKVMNVIY